MARRRQQARTAPQEPPLVFGEHRIGAGWIGIGIAGAAFLAVGAAMIAADAPDVMLAVGPILAIFAASCAKTRVVRLDPEAREVLVTRRLIGPGRTQRLAFGGFRTLAVSVLVMVPRFARWDGTMEGKQRFMRFELTLRGRWWRVRLPDGVLPEGEPAQRREAAEDLARRLARLMGIPAERRGYRVEESDAGTLTVPRRGAVEPLG